jgi:hypothetical protein
MLNPKIADHHLTRQACIDIRQSTPAQVRFNQESTERHYNLADQAKALGWIPEQVRILDGDLVVGTTDDQARRLQNPGERCRDGARRRDLLAGSDAPGALQQGLAPLAGAVCDHQDIGVRRRWLLRSIRLQRQPCPRHERHVRSSGASHHPRFRQGQVVSIPPDHPSAYNFV